MIQEYSKYQNLYEIHQPIQLLEEAVKSEPRLGVLHFVKLGDALHKTKQRARVEEIFKVCTIEKFGDIHGLGP